MAKSFLQLFGEAKGVYEREDDDGSDNEFNPISGSEAFEPEQMSSEMRELYFQSRRKDDDDADDGDAADDAEKEQQEPEGVDKDADPYAMDTKKPPSEDDSRPVDSDGKRYNPSAGAQSLSQCLKAGRCGAILENWFERYSEPRYCSRYPIGNVSGDPEKGRCHIHHPDEE